jgi:hypothetical protein
MARIVWDATWMAEKLDTVLQAWEKWIFAKPSEIRRIITARV